MTVQLIKWKQPTKTESGCKKWRKYNSQNENSQQIHAKKIVGKSIETSEEKTYQYNEWENSKGKSFNWKKNVNEPNK